MLKKYITGAIVLLLFIFSVSLARRQSDIFVSPEGNDINSGTKQHPVKSIQRGIDLVKPGSTVEILPGTYRETLTISDNSTFSWPLRLHGNTANGRGVILTGAEPASALIWSTCDSASCPGLPPAIARHVYTTTLNWAEPPTILIELVSNGSEHELIRARSPNPRVENPDKFHEFWWQATGTGQSQAILMDTTNLTGNVNVTGGRAFIVDGADRCGTFLYVRTVKTHNRTQGSLTMNAPIGALTYGNQENGISGYTKYFIDNAIGLLDSPGEWFYDNASQRLYVWPLEEKNPESLQVEIGRRDTGIHLNRSRVDIENITITTINDHDYFTSPTGAIVMNPNREINTIGLRHLSILFSGSGIMAEPDHDGSIRNIVIDSTTLRDISKSSISMTGLPENANSLKNVKIHGSNIGQAGFPFNEAAIAVTRSNNVRITGNTINNVASYGIHVTGYEKNNNTARDILIADNSVSHACQNASGCAAIKIFGGSFSDTRISNNAVHDQLGWSYCREAKDRLSGYGMGIFISNASGIRVSSNQSVKNSGAAYLAFTRQLPAMNNSFEDNLAQDSGMGIVLQGAQEDSDADPQANSTRHDYTTIMHNTLKNNQTALVLDPAHPRTVRISGNIYKNNIDALSSAGEIISTPSAILRIFPYWEE